MEILCEPAICTLIEGRGVLIDRLLRVKHPRRFYSRAYRDGLWDGVIHFYNLSERTFPTGLLSKVLSGLKEIGVKPKITDKRNLPTITGKIEEGCLYDITLRDYQLGCANTILEKKVGIIDAATGSGKTEVQAAVAAFLFREHGLRTILFVPKIGLLEQTAERMRVEIGPDVKVGRVGNGRREIDADIIIATPQTLQQALPAVTKEDKFGRRKITRRHDPRMTNLIRKMGVLMIDEVHHAKSRSWFDLAMMCNASFRLGFSGTVKTGDIEADTRLISSTGPVIYKVGAKMLVDRGILAKPIVNFVTDSRLFQKKEPPWVKCESALSYYKRCYDSLIVANDDYNNAIAKLIGKLIETGRPPFVLATRVEHMREIMRKCEQHGVACEMLYGVHSTGIRDEVKKRYAQNVNFAIVASTIFDEGEDVPTIRSIILAGGGKSVVALFQRIGRGMRRKAKDNKVMIYDFAHSFSEGMLKHSIRRVSELEKREYSLKNIHNFAQYLAELK